MIWPRKQIKFNFVYGLILRTCLDRIRSYFTHVLLELKSIHCERNDRTVSAVSTAITEKAAMRYGVQKCKHISEYL